MVWLFIVAFCLSSFRDLKRLATLLIPVPSYITLCLVFICGKLDGWVKSSWQVVLAPIWTLELLCTIALLRFASISIFLIKRQGMRDLRLAAIYSKAKRIQTYLKITAWIPAVLFTVLAMYKAETGLKIPWIGIFSFAWLGIIQLYIWILVS